MSLTAAAFDYALKTLYPDGIVAEVYKNNPLLALLPKDTEFEGRNMVVDVLYGDTQGRSAGFSNAQTNALASSHKGVPFTITRKADYALAYIDRQTMLATKNQSGAVAAALATEMNSAINVLKNSLAHAVWGDGGGNLGQISAIAGSTFTLVNATDTTNFEVGKVLNLSATKSGGAIRAGGTLTVTAVARSTGVVTCSAGIVATIAGAVVNDYVFTDGDYGAKLAGVQGWIPTADPTGGDSWFGVDRSVDPTKLAGVRFDGSALPIEEAFIQCGARLGLEEGAPKYAFCNFLDFANLETSLGSKKVYEDIEGPYGIGFQGISIRGPLGSIKVLADRNCPRGVAYMLDLDSWCLHSLKEAPHIIKDDGLDMLRQSTADGFEIRMAYYAQLATNAPGHNARVTLAT